jgi:hypothetical protein
VDQEQVGQTINSSQVLGPVGGSNNSTGNPADQQQEEQQQDQDKQQGDSESSDSSDEGEQGQTVGDFLLNPMGNNQVQLNQSIEEPITSGSDLIINDSPGNF